MQEQLQPKGLLEEPKHLLVAKPLQLQQQLLQLRRIL